MLFCIVKSTSPEVFALSGRASKALPFQVSVCGSQSLKSSHVFPHSPGLQSRLRSETWRNAAEWTLKKYSSWSIWGFAVFWAIRKCSKGVPTVTKTKLPDPLDPWQQSVPLVSPRNCKRGAQADKIKAYEDAEEWTPTPGALCHSGHRTKVSTNQH